MNKLILITFFVWVSTISCKAEEEVVFDEQKLQSWCSKNGVRRHYYIIPQTYQFAKAFCRATGGRLYEPKCKASNDRLSQLTKKHTHMVSFLLCIVGLCYLFNKSIQTYYSHLQISDHILKVLVESKFNLKANIFLISRSQKNGYFWNIFINCRHCNSFDDSVKCQLIYISGRRLTAL